MLFVSSANAIEEASFVDSQSDLHKISLEEAINMALEGNIELQEQRKNLGISKYTVEKANALKNPQFQSNVLMGPIARGNSSQIGLMLPIEINKRDFMFYNDKDIKHNDITQLYSKGERISGEISKMDGLDVISYYNDDITFDLLFGADGKVASMSLSIVE